MGLDTRIADAKLCLDTTPIIYFIERNETYINLIRPIFAGIDAGKNEAITSTITLLEVLVHPYRTITRHWQKNTVRYYCIQKG